MIEVIEPGFMTTVQDRGRPGLYTDGIGPSGAMDMHAHAIGNALVGNAPGAATLEMTFTGPALRMAERTRIASTGDLPLKINGEEVAGWESHDVEADDIVSFGFIRSGMRAYLAVNGGIDVPEYLGSRSTNCFLRIGGFEGRPLASGDRLPVGEGSDGPHRSLAADLRRTYPKEVELRYVPGLFNYRLRAEGVSRFESTQWAVGTAADRTGVRFAAAEQHRLEFVDREPPFGAGSDPSNVVDSGYPIGSIQVPGGLDPIVLGRDGVTAGGYFTVGTVISADIDRLAQLPMRSRARFAAVTVSEALTIRQQARDSTDEAIASLS